MAFLLIFSLLVAQFNSFFQPFAIMTALPLSVVGAILGLLVTNNAFTIMSFVGLVGLTGIVVNDSIVLVDCVNRMRQTGLDIFAAIVSAGQQRLKPIISTTVTTIGGIITLTITDELWEGLGVVIIFGIALATILTLVVVPVMYSLFEGLGLQVSSAATGPLVLDPPQGRSFFFTRRRWAWLGLFLVLVVQAVVLAAGLSQLIPWISSQIQSAVFRAPTQLKLYIEIAGLRPGTGPVERGGAGAPPDAPLAGPAAGYEPAEPGRVLRGHPARRRGPDFPGRVPVPAGRPDQKGQVLAGVRRPDHPGRRPPHPADRPGGRRADAGKSPLGPLALHRPAPA